MIQVAAFLSWRCASGSTEFAIDRHEIDDGTAGTKLNQTDFILASFYC
jgi:hypothetical protein